VLGPSRVVPRCCPVQVSYRYTAREVNRPEVPGFGPMPRSGLPRGSPQIERQRVRFCPVSASVQLTGCPLAADRLPARQRRAARVLRRRRRRAARARPGRRRRAARARPGRRRRAARAPCAAELEAAHNEPGGRGGLCPRTPRNRTRGAAPLRPFAPPRARTPRRRRNPATTEQREQQEDGAPEGPLLDQVTLLVADDATHGEPLGLRVAGF
jgi:hypothetical protein